MAKNTIDEHDRKTLREAKQRVMVVYEYNYGANRVTRLLETIIKKLDYLIKDGAKMDGDGNG